jgi:hypothetical protein
MNRPTKIRKIYRELRAVLGSELSAKEALRSAAMLVELYEGGGPSHGANIHEQRPKFYELPVDEAISDGGWRVMAGENLMLDAVFGEEDIDIRKQMQRWNYGLEVAA